MVNHMLVPLDGCRLAECVLPHAVALARALDARVTVLRALDRGSSGAGSERITPLRWRILRSEAETYLRNVASRLESAGLDTDWALVEGAAAERIVAFADTDDADLVLLSSHGRSGLSGWNVGSVVQKVALRCYTTTMIVQAYRTPCRDLTGLRYEQILIPVDGSRRAECVLPLAMCLVEFYPCRLLLAHVVREPEMPRRVPLTEEELTLRDQLVKVNRRAGRDYLDRLASLLPADVETRLVVNDHPVDLLHELARQETVDLVVLGAHGYSGSVQRPYGHIALNFIAYGTTPLIVVQDLPREDAEMTTAERAAKQAGIVRRSLRRRQPVASGEG